MALNFTKKDVDIGSLYTTGGSVSLTLTGFYVGATQKTIASLYNHFHSASGLNPSLTNSVGLTTAGVDNGGLYCPAQMISSTAASALSAAVEVPNAANGI